MAGTPVATDASVRFIEATSAENEAATMDEICQRVADGESLGEVCKAWAMPYSRVAGWIASSKVRSDAYQVALSMYADALVASAIKISAETQEGQTVKAGPDGTTVTTEDMLGHRKLRIDTHFKAASKYDRARFGDSVQHTGKKDEPLIIQTIERVIVDPGDKGV